MTQRNGNTFHGHGLKQKYCQNVYTTPRNLQIECSPYQNTNSIFHRTRTNNPKICMEPQKTLNSQRNLEKKRTKQSWRHHNSTLQVILQGYNHQNNMVLAQKQTHRSTEQNRIARNKPTTTWLINLQ